MPTIFGGWKFWSVVVYFQRTYIGYVIVIARAPVLALQAGAVV